MYIEVTIFVGVFTC